ncbi:transglycosylase domain-containing protein [Brevibacterium album]|uniref:transglycosylase domain-containing protein n=1 Tax=Brevibacterium album TaxID=417948 RepID=UPI0009FC8695|nr:transglycosylase domain-containing protein [Brevibacterium album]
MVTSGSSIQQGASFRALVHFVAVSCIAGLVGAGLAIPAVGGAAAGAETGAEVFSALPAELDERPLAEQSRMLAADGSEIATFYWQNREEVAFDEISQAMKDATVAVEDERFYEHTGVDIQGIARAAVSNAVSSSTQGGSTLTQQYVKNVLAQNAYAEGDEEGYAEAIQSDGTEGYARKLREVKLAVALENQLGKDEILHRYLNINNYSGSPNVYGVEAAAHRYWGVSAAELDVQQSATLAGIVQNPYANNPERHPERTLERRNTVLDLMLRNGFIDEAEHRQARESELELDIHTTPNGCVTAEGMAYFCDYVQRIIETDEAFGGDEEERKRLLQRGGLTIHTTLDPDIQEIAHREVNDRIPADDASAAGHTAVTVEPGTGRVIAMAQNRDYTVAEAEDASETQLNYNVDRAHNGANGFQVGSTWKPFVLAEWLREGHGLNETVDATRRNFPAGSWRYDGCASMAGDWNPRNAGDSDASPSMSALEATRSSTNTAYAAMGSQLNMCGILDTAESLGIGYGSGDPLDTADEEGFVPALSPASILGTVQVAPLDMAAAFAAFAADGEFCRPTAIDSITTSGGEELEVPSAGCEQAIDEDVARGVSYAMSRTFDGGTTSGLGIGVPAAAKTGTTNFDVGSTSLIGFTRSLSTFVWTGDPDRNRDWRTEGAGAVSGRIYGATISGRTWQSIMREAAPLAGDNGGFSAPSTGGVAGAAGGAPDAADGSDEGENPDGEDAGGENPDREDAGAEEDGSPDSEGRDDSPDSGGADGDTGFGGT